MEEPAVIVLLIHDAESRLQRLVERVFEATEEVLCRLSVVIVDDGSRDDTYEVASELARVYPQVRVLRQPRQAGLGAALERVRQAVSVSRAIVYDGTSPLASGDLAAMLAEATPAEQATVGGDQARGSRRFAAVRQLNDALERAHRPLTAFRWLPLDSHRQGDARDASFIDPMPPEVSDVGMPLAVR